MSAAVGIHVEPLLHQGRETFTGCWYH